MFRSVLCLVVITLLFQIVAQGQQLQHFQKESTLLKNVILANHFSPRPLDDNFSQIVYRTFLDKLDPNRLYFTQDDLSTLSSYNKRIDDDLNANSLSFLLVATKLYKQSLERSLSITEALLKAPFDFNIKEILDADTLWSANQKENAERWRQHLKLIALNQLMTRIESDKDNTDQNFIKANEGQVRERVRLVTTRSIKRILNHPSGFDQ